MMKKLALLESSGPLLENKENSLLDALPVKTLEEFQRFDASLDGDDNKRFKQLVSSIIQFVFIRYIFVWICESRKLTLKSKNYCTTKT